VCDDDGDGPAAAAKVQFDSLPLLVRAQPAVRVDWAILNAHEYELFFGEETPTLSMSCECHTLVEQVSLRSFARGKSIRRDVKLLKRIGEGHFSTVWLARRFGEKVAVKQLRPRTGAPTACSASLRTKSSE
jgi:hypothetical protein